MWNIVLFMVLVGACATNKVIATPTTAPDYEHQSQAVSFYERVAKFVRGGNFYAAEETISDLREVEELKLDVLKCVALAKAGSHAQAKSLFQRRPIPAGTLARDLYNLVREALVFVYITPERTPITETMEELLLKGTGWIWVDAADIRKKMNVPATAELSVNLVGKSSAGSGIARERKVSGDQQRVHIAFWAGATRVTIATSQPDNMIEGTADVVGWSDTPVAIVINAKAEIPQSKLVVAYDSDGKLFNLTLPEDASPAGYIFWIFGQNPNEVIYQRQLAPNEKSLSLSDINKTVGPLVPTIIDPDKQEYNVVVFPVDKEGRQAGSSASIRIGIKHD